MVTEMDAIYGPNSMDSIFSLKLIQLVPQLIVEPIQKQILIVSP